jgi:hypothetical protein
MWRQFWFCTIFKSRPRHAQNQNALNAISLSSLIMSFRENFSMLVQNRDMCPQFYKSTFFYFVFIPLLVRAAEFAT